MNERVLELAKQANLKFSSETDLSPPEKKFAELIVRECIDILMRPSYQMTHPEELSRYNEGWVRGRLLGIDHIKEHFGVEE